MGEWQWPLFCLTKTLNTCGLLFLGECVAFSLKKKAKKQKKTTTTTTITTTDGKPFKEN